ncbi:MAG: hypothetical protein K0R66_832 [Gammaproteobacteria bacterium]|nr:hypothetical protein [Gammaproteobacteria bacterium]
MGYQIAIKSGVTTHTLKFGTSTLKIDQPSLSHLSSIKINNKHGQEIAGTLPKEQAAPLISAMQKTQYAPLLDDLLTVSSNFEAHISKYLQFVEDSIYLAIGRSAIESETGLRLLGKLDSIKKAPVSSVYAVASPVGAISSAARVQAHDLAKTIKP